MQHVMTVQPCPTGGMWGILMTGGRRDHRTDLGPFVLHCRVLVVWWPVALCWWCGGHQAKAEMAAQAADGGVI